MSWRIRSAHDGDAVACRDLLPDLFPVAGHAPELIVAERDGGEIVGAVATIWAEHGFPFGLAVAPAWRRRGVGATLLTAALEAARGETHALRTAAAIPTESGEASFLAALGFAERRRFLRFEADEDGAGFAHRLSTLLQRLRATPPRIVPMREAPMDQAVALLATTFTALPFALARRLTPGAAHGYDLDLSMVALEGDRVIAAVACTREGDALDIDLNVVAPDRRRGIVNLAVLEAIGRRGREAGIGRYVFACEPHVRDTLNLALRSRARALPSKIIMARAVD